MSVQEREHTRHGQGRYLGIECPAQIFVRSAASEYKRLGER